MKIMLPLVKRLELLSSKCIEKCKIKQDILNEITNKTQKGHKIRLLKIRLKIIF